MAKKRNRKKNKSSASAISQVDTQVKQSGFLIRVHEFIILLAFVVLVFLIYSNTFNAPFILDDRPNIENNPHIRLTGMSLENLRNAGLQGVSKNRPIPKISFALNYYFHQYDLQGYHLVNILIHITTGIFFYLFLKSTLSLTSPQAGDRRYAWVPFLAVLIWLVHPAQTQSVTYIVQRMNSLAAMFYILSLLFFVKARLSKKRGRKALLYTGCILAGILGLGSKQITATLPLFIFLYEWYFFQDLSRTWLKRHAVPLVGTLMILFTVALFYLGINPIERVLATYEHRDFTLGQRVLTQFRVVIFYISLLIFPHPSRLNLDRDFALSYSLFNPLTTLLSMAVIMGLIGVAVYSAKRQRLVSFGILWFLGNLIIESSVVGLEIIFDHRTYLPSMFVIFLAVLLVHRYVRPKIAGFIFLGAVAIVFSVWTHDRNDTWNDEVTLWQDCVKKSHNKARPHNNLGVYLKAQGRSEDAIRHYSEALRIKPDYAEVHNNMCTALFSQDRIQEAFTHCTAALLIKPGYAEAHSNLGMVLASLGRPGEAISHYSEALRIKPDYAEVHNNMCTVLNKQGRIQEAFSHCTAALRIKPGYADAHSNLGVILARLGRLGEAINHYSEALRIKPDHANAHNNLGDALSRQGKHKEAIHHFSEALRINPNFAKAHFGVGRTFQKLDQLDEAIDHFSRATQIQPDFYEAYYRLGNTLREQNKTDEAIRSFLRAIKIKPDYAAAQNNLGIALAMQGKFQEAVKHLSEAVRLKPRDADYHFNLANALADRGQHKEALDHFSEAAGLNPVDAELQAALKRAKSMAAESDMN
jgi:tetratricopeptide (TPR) repeat protein